MLYFLRVAGRCEADDGGTRPTQKSAERPGVCPAFDNGREQGQELLSKRLMHPVIEQPL